MDNNNYVLCPGCQNYEYSTEPKCRRCGYILMTQQPQFLYNHQISRNQPIQPVYNYQPQKQKKKYSCLADVIGSIALLFLLGLAGNSLNNYIDKERAERNSTTESNVEHTASTTTTEEHTATTTEEQIKVTTEGKVIYGENDVIIKITGISGNNVSFYIENNSALNLGFNMHSYAVNGLMTNENIYTMDCNVAPNSKNTCALEIPNTFLKEYDIDVIKNLTLHIWAYNNDTYMKEFDCGSIVVDTSASDGANSIQSGEILLEENGLKYELLKKQGNVYYIGITNNNDILCEFDIQNLVINDWTCDISYDFDLMGLQILPNCQNILALDMTKHMQEKGVTETEYISFNLDVRRNADYFDNYIGSTIRIE